MNSISAPDFWTCFAVVAAAAGAGLLTYAVRNNRLLRGPMSAITILCGGAMLAMVLTDFPLEMLNDFWAGHSVLASLLSSLLLVGLVFMVYQHGEQRKQQRLANGLTGAGLGGFVEAVVDVEVALALLSCPQQPDQIQPQHWSGWTSPGKPLRWLRYGRDILTSENDPRNAPVPVDQPIAPWGQCLIDQAIRRLLGAMRDWSPLIGASEDGTEILLLLSDVRADLMKLRGSLPAGALSAPGALSVLTRLRIRLRVLALCCETWNEAPLREEIIDTLDLLSQALPEFKTESRSLKKRLDASYGDLLKNQERGRRYGVLPGTVMAGQPGESLEQ
jgi:hypothetical protein